LPDVPSHQSEASKGQILSYLNLKKRESPNDVVVVEDNNNDDDSSTKDNLNVPSSSSSSNNNVVRPKPGSYAKFLSIDVSSPLGCYITDLTKTGIEAENRIDIRSLCTVERRTTGQRGSRRTRFPVTYRGSRDRLEKKQSPHVYCFTREQHCLRLQTLRTGKRLF
jgi:hypothetical protein